MGQGVVAAVKQMAAVNPGKKRAKEKRKEKTDYGKIAALHKAKWTQEKIADEMGVSAGEVSAALELYKEKLEAGYIWDAGTRDFIEKGAG